MNNEFPKMLYRCPGPMAYEGATYDTTIVADADEEAAAEGWFSTTTAAKAAHDEQIAAAKAAEALTTVKVADPEPSVEADPEPSVEADPAPVVAKSKKA